MALVWGALEVDAHVPTHILPQLVLVAFSE